MSTQIAIGEFARLTHLSVKALRHYHDVGVLIPASIDANSGYRSYDLTQVHDAHVVRRLRELDLPLDGIREVLDPSSESERDRSLAEHLEHMERELDRTRHVVASLRSLLQTDLRPFDVEVRQLDPVRALAFSADVEATDIEAWSIKAFARLERALGSDDALDVAGLPTSMFGQDYFTEGLGRVTALVPVGSDADPENAGLELVEFAATQYAVAVHHGPYSDLDQTYGALGTYVAEHFTATTDPIVEHYVVGSDQTNDPSEFRTRVHWPIAI